MTIVLAKNEFQGAGSWCSDERVVGVASNPRYSLWIRVQLSANLHPGAGQMTAVTLCYLKSIWEPQTKFQAPDSLSAPTPWLL